MIVYHLKDLMLQKSAKEGRRITYDDMAEATGISKVTLSRIASKLGYRTNTENIELLCRYFECTPNELMTIVDEKEQSEQNTNQSP